MANGWAPDSAVQDQIDATIADEVKRARSLLQEGPGLIYCEECNLEIPEARRLAVPGVRLCIQCQQLLEEDTEHFAGYNRRGSKDSQLR